MGWYNNKKDKRGDLMTREEKKEIYVPPREREYRMFFNGVNMCYEEVE